RATATREQRADPRRKRTHGFLRARFGSDQGQAGPVDVQRQEPPLNAVVPVPCIQVVGRPRDEFGAVLLDQETRNPVECLEVGSRLEGRVEPARGIAKESVVPDHAPPIVRRTARTGLASNPSSGRGKATSPYSPGGTSRRMRPSRIAISCLRIALCAG